MRGIENRIVRLEHARPHPAKIERLLERMTRGRERVAALGGEMRQSTAEERAELVGKSIPEIIAAERARVAQSSTADPAAKAVLHG